MLGMSFALSVNLLSSSLHAGHTVVGCGDNINLKQKEEPEKIEKFLTPSSSPIDPVFWIDPSRERSTSVLHYSHLIDSDSSSQKTALETVTSIQDEGYEVKTVDLNVLKKTVQGLENTPVDLDSGTILYSPFMQATNESLLIPIQKTLKLCIVRDIQSRCHWPKEYAWFLEKMPKDVPELIQFMYDERVLSELTSAELTVLKHAYQLGFTYFDLGSSIYTATNSPVQLQLTPEDAEDLKKAYSQAYPILSKLITPPRDSIDQEDDNLHTEVR